MWRSVRGRVRRVLRDFRPDCVLSYWTHPDGDAAARAAREAGVPFALRVGGSDVLVLGRDPRHRPAITRVLAAADAVIAVSHDLRAKTVALGVPAGRVHVVNQGVDADRFHPGDRAAARRKLGLPDEGPLLLWVGRMAPLKGLEVLVAAAALLRDWGVAFHLHLVGDGPARAAVAADVAARGLAGRVSFAGVRTHDELPDWYRAADLTVLSSHSEGIPNVLRESLACGTPYVSTDVGGVRELSADPTVRLVPPKDPAAFADAVAAGLRDAAAGRRPANESHSWDEAAASLTAVLAPLVRTPVPAACVPA
jgi:glycosyltransferase involved in cell wall biosynthesis